jgi:hypothetical protein
MGHECHKQALFRRVNVVSLLLPECDSNRYYGTQYQRDKRENIDKFQSPDDFHLAASSNCFRQDVCGLAVVAAELKFRDLRPKAFAAAFVKAADRATHDQAPEALNSARAERADNDAHVFAEILIREPSARTVAQFSRRLVAAETHQSVEFQGHSLTHWNIKRTFCLTY